MTSDTAAVSTEKDYGDTEDARGTPEVLVRELHKANGGLFATDTVLAEAHPFRGGCER